MGEDAIKFNFFGLSFSRQNMILDMYLNDVNIEDYDGEYDKIFEKYMLVARKFSEFNDHFAAFGDEDRKRMRELIEKCRAKINPNNEIRVNDDCQYSSNRISDKFVDEYIRDSFSYSRVKRIDVASDFFEFYSEIEEYSFDEILGLFNSKKDFFNDEIKKISSEFYSLYLVMNTVDRMKYIWYLSNFQIFSSEVTNDGELDMYGIFNGDDEFIKPIHQGSKEKMEKSSVLSKYFKGV